MKIVLEETVKKLNKSKKNHDKVNDLLAEPFNLAPSLVVGKELTPRKRKLVEEKKHVEGEYKKSQAAVKKLKLDHNEQVSHHAAETCRLNKDLGVAEQQISTLTKQMGELSIELKTYKKRLRVLKAKYHKSKVVEIFYVQPVGLFRLTCQVYLTISSLLVQQVIIRISFRVQSSMVQLIRKK